MPAKAISFITSIAIGCAVLLFSSSARTASAEVQDEYALKAAFILNFLRFSEIPQTKPGELILCVYQDAEAFEFTKVLENKRIGERMLRVQLVKLDDEIPRCTAIYIPQQTEGTRARILKTLKGHSILTIGEEPEFVMSGGMIAFTRAVDRIRFTISSTNANMVNINFRANLLALATKIEDK